MTASCPYPSREQAFAPERPATLAAVARIHTGHLAPAMAVALPPSLLMVSATVTGFTPPALQEQAGEIYGKQESCKDVVDDQIPFHLKKQSVSR